MILVDYSLEAQMIGYVAMQVLFLLVWLEYGDASPFLRYFSLGGFLFMALFMKFAMRGVMVVN